VGGAGLSIHVVSLKIKGFLPIFGGAAHIDLSRNGEFPPMFQGWIKLSV
jgi:hypothetical protein